jgi:hypothetical protein
LIATYVWKVASVNRVQDTFLVLTYRGQGEAP